MPWSSNGPRARKRYERQGILVTAEALRRAEEECLADEERRARQRERAAERRENEDLEYLAAVTVKLKELFPGCPPEEAARIATWSCQKHSGRVGRSAAAKDFDPQALRLAVMLTSGTSTPATTNSSCNTATGSRPVKWSALKLRRCSCAGSALKSQPRSAPAVNDDRGHRAVSRAAAWGNRENRRQNRRVPRRPRNNAFAE